jgi:undecaprenyl-diphosphatase
MGGRAGRTDRPGVYLCAVDPEERTFAHPVWIAVVSGVVLVVSYVVANLDPVPSWEVSVTRWFNAAPEWLADVLYPVMQLGTLWAPVLVAVAVLFLSGGTTRQGATSRRNWLAAGAVAVGGVLAWFAAKGVKQIVGRGRPPEYITDIVVREGEGTGLGYVSGHSAVAAATATVLMLVVPRRARPVLILLVFLVGMARIVYGLHLPVDVVGGWAFGCLIGLAVVEVVDRLHSRARSAEPSPRPQVAQPPAPPTLPADVSRGSEPLSG